MRQKSLDVSSQSFNIIETHELSPTLVNQARVGWVNYSDVTAGLAAPAADLSALGFTNTFPVTGQSFPNIQFQNGIGTGGGTYNVPNSWDFAIWNGEDSISWTHGKHSFSVGGLIYIDNGLTNPVQNQTAQFTFGGSYTAPKGATPTGGRRGSRSSWVGWPYGFAQPSPRPLEVKL